jgi:hypothetical protein
VPVRVGDRFGYEKVRRVLYLPGPPGRGNIHADRYGGSVGDAFDGSGEAAAVICQGSGINAPSEFA